MVLGLNPIAPMMSLIRWVLKVGINHILEGRDPFIRELSIKSLDDGCIAIRAISGTYRWIPEISKAKQ